ncbi:LRRCT [Chamberlinius hualienensis]
MALCGLVVWVMMTLLVVMLEPLSLVWSMATCPYMCTCRYKAGKETSECINRRLAKVPVGLSKGTQVLDISKNNLRQLMKEEFYHAGLVNLQKLYVSECKIRKIDDGAFKHLANLVELDLGDNLLISVPTETFEDYPELRRLNLNKNSIRRIETMAFIKLPNLSDLELSNCHIEYLGPKAFVGLESLQDLRLNGNRLTTLPIDVGFPIKSLRNLQVYDNPWLCDCHLRVFHKWLVYDGLPVSSSPVCESPSRLKGRSLGQIASEDYACIPQASFYQEYVAEANNGDGAKLICNVYSDPSPDIRWTYEGRILTNFSRASSNSKVYSIQENGGVNRMSVLSIKPVNFDDSGDYLCVAENLAGQVVINITLEVIERTAEASSLSNGHIAGISIGLIVVSAVTTVFICILLTKLRKQNQQSDERKHLELVDKKQSVHLVNHTTGSGLKYEVKQRVQMAPNAENNSLLKKPLITGKSTGGGHGGSHDVCSVGIDGKTTTDNNSPTAQEMLRLEDSIGGLLIRSSSRMSSNKPDVVNFTCSNGASYSPEEMFNHQMMKSSNSNSKISPVISLDNIKDSIRMIKSSSSKDSSFFLTEKSDSKERLCEYVQLYEEVEQRDAQFDAQRDAQFDAQLKMKSDVNLQSCSDTNNTNIVGAVSGEMIINENNKLVESNNKPSKNGNRSSSAAVNKQRYGPLGNACGGILKHVNLHGRNYVPVLPPLPVHHFAQVRDSPDEGYEDEVEDEMDT